MPGSTELKYVKQHLHSTLQTQVDYCWVAAQVPTLNAFSTSLLISSTCRTQSKSLVVQVLSAARETSLCRLLVLLLAVLMMRNQAASSQAAVLLSSCRSSCML
jgi:hypothetical protein